MSKTAGMNDMRSVNNNKQIAAANISREIPATGQRPAERTEVVQNTRDAVVAQHSSVQGVTKKGVPYSSPDEQTAQIISETLKWIDDLKTDPSNNSDDYNAALARISPKTLNLLVKLAAHYVLNPERDINIMDEDSQIA